MKIEENTKILNSIWMVYFTKLFHLIAIAQFFYLFRYFYHCSFMRKQSIMKDVSAVGAFSVFSLFLFLRKLRNVRKAF